MLFPVFALSSPFRLYPELVSAFPNLVRRGSFAMRYLHRVTWYPLSPARMAERVRLLSGVDFAEDCHQVKAPTLVVTGEPNLDRVVPVESTREYVAVIPGATYEQLTGTGHVGLITKPDRFRGIVGSFVAAHAERSEAPEQVLA